MRRLVLVFLCACPADRPPPDANLDYGSPCINDGTSPLMACETPGGLVGWCVDSACRRSCNKGSAVTGCTFDETPIAIFNDCYCQPH